MPQRWCEFTRRMMALVGARNCDEWRKQKWRDRKLRHLRLEICEWEQMKWRKETLDWRQLRLLKWRDIPTELAETCGGMQVK